MLIARQADTLKRPDQLDREQSSTSGPHGVRHEHVDEHHTLHTTVKDIDLQHRWPGPVPYRGRDRTARRNAPTAGPAASPNASAPASSAIRLTSPVTCRQDNPDPRPPRHSLATRASSATNAYSLGCSHRSSAAWSLPIPARNPAVQHHHHPARGCRQDPPVASALNSTPPATSTRRTGSPIRRPASDAMIIAIVIN